MDVPKEIEALVAPVLAEAGVEVVDVEWRGEPVGWVLRLYLDKAGGFSLADCASWNDRLGDLIDAAGIISHRYSLEISSPGLNRPIKKRADFERYMGLECVVKTHAPLNNQRNFRGKMVSLEGDDLMLLDRTSGLARIPLTAISQAKLDQGR